MSSHIFPVPGSVGQQLVKMRPVVTNSAANLIFCWSEETDMRIVVRFVNWVGMDGLELAGTHTSNVNQKAVMHFRKKFGSKGPIKSICRKHQRIELIFSIRLTARNVISVYIRRIVNKLSFESSTRLSKMIKKRLEGKRRIGV